MMTLTNSLCVNGLGRKAEAPTSSASALSLGVALALITSTGTCCSDGVERMYPQDRIATQFRQQEAEADDVRPHLGEEHHRSAPSFDFDDSCAQPGQVLTYDPPDPLIVFDDQCQRAPIV